MLAIAAATSSFRCMRHCLMWLALLPPLPAAAANPGCPNGWTGVQCDPATGRVTGLDLSNIQLCFALNPCPLPTALLEQLSALDTLRLRGAGISGQLADLDLSILPRLRALDLSGNPGMLGPLPGDWPTSAPNLVSLELSGISGMVRLQPASTCLELLQLGVTCMLWVQQPSSPTATGAAACHCRARCLPPGSTAHGPTSPRCTCLVAACHLCRPSGACRRSRSWTSAATT